MNPTCSELSNEKFSFDKLSINILITKSSFGSLKSSYNLAKNKIAIEISEFGC